MFRPIRKKSNEISLDEVNKLLINARRGVLAVNGDDNYPYAIPINYYYDIDKQKIFFHSSSIGHKVDALNKSSKVCFTVTGNEEIKDEQWAPYVKSVVVFGCCKKIEDEKQKQTRLKQFATKYYPNENMVDEEMLRSSKAASMYEISIEHISGKQVQER